MTKRKRYSAELDAKGALEAIREELKNRGAQGILIAVVDGLKGFPEAITAAFPEATVQACIAHLVRQPRTSAPGKIARLSPPICA